MKAMLWIVGIMVVVGVMFGGDDGNARDETDEVSSEDRYGDDLDEPLARTRAMTSGA